MPLTAEQQAALQLLKEAFPDAKQLKAVIAQELLPSVLKIPVYSNRGLEDTPANVAGYQISNVTTMMAGSFAWCYAEDSNLRNPETGRMGDIVVALVKRGDKGPNGEDRFGALGGFTNLDFVEKPDGTKDWSKGEQPKEGAAREIREESVDSKGVPVLAPKAERMELLLNGHDYRGRPATNYTAHSLEMTPLELAGLKIHSEKLANDPDYLAGAKKASNNEVANIEMKPLREILAMGRDSFTHPHEYDALAKLNERLQGKQTQVTR